MSASSSSRTVLGFDYGTRRIGIATGQEVTGTAQGLTTVNCSDGKPDWPRIDQLISEWRPDVLVIGMPHNMDDRPHPLLPVIQDFGNQLKQRYNLPIDWIDEKLSSMEAENLIAASHRPRHRKQDKSEIDKLAAELILQSWLNNNAN